MDLRPILNWIVILASSIVATAILLVVINLVLKRIGRRTVAIGGAWKKVRIPIAILLLCTALRVGIAQLPAESPVRGIGLHLMLIGIIVGAVWLIDAVVLVWLGHTQQRMAKKMRDDDRARRRVQTQMQLISRVVNVIFVIIGAALVLLTFPGVKQLGTAVLASAGLLSVVVGMAAQTSLGNLFAGLQLAFTDAIRIGDIVEVDGTWATVEDITLSYVVVSIWTEQHKVLPSTYFTTTPFINWSRKGESVIGLIYFSLDWRTDVEAFREEFNRLVENSPEWDGRVRAVRVTDASEDRLAVRAQVSSRNTDDDWVLTCNIREGMATWLQRTQP
ncbi:MAG TPA: mechanosensitive ion channel domain-containing protein, partial [Ruania sp.]|nr:mechanosensitive ion channel domain-containing protein [Ruania sp.]